MTACDSMEWQGTMYTVSEFTMTRYRRQYLDLTINNSINGDTTSTIACDSAVWQGTTYVSSGMYYDTLQTAWM